ncbi:ribosomal protein large subunit L5 [Thermoplasma volcanium GSS1]|uniref:Large ribosomal subunit protein uL18 n=1 Tax=Thermoplasma volcanium (strain ATCC 51530 / DSM 4299 / JCM 9571 / NBRC 15438 / GSS1) TaxID=273116 RepID=RL18_THEVO|nr:50S ribosomal protein L18 [Thermoplasma volcanium]Q97BV7.1 RecName: Full=Large ribosomal subunit protein uL18; AltName: Full=50S ribosomal protein L18 [Thermoplasma volcanium GSS1]BAB59490.1 ribosomal protein large subunit L5 [Thermoplasma volcanium GSS1]
MAFKRKVLGKTDYGRRLRLLKSKDRRFIVRITNKGIIAQIAEYSVNGDRILATITDKALSKYGIELRGNNLQICYLVGYAAGVEAQKAGVETAVLDIGRKKFRKGGRIAACLKGITDSGVDIPHGEDVFPDKKRLNGSHLKNPVKLNEAVKNFKKLEEKA